MVGLNTFWGLETDSAVSTKQRRHLRICQVARLAASGGEKEGDVG